MADGRFFDADQHHRRIERHRAKGRNGDTMQLTGRILCRNNRHAARDSTTNLISNLTQAKLVRINQATQAIEPSLAERWTTADEGTRVTITLKRDVLFSDGHPFTADDVLFAFEAAYDETSGSALADSVQAGGKKLQVKASDPHTVVITFPAPFAPGIRILDGLPILPRHRLQGALKAGAFTKAWGLDTPPSEIVGLGPFVLTEYVPGSVATPTTRGTHRRVDQQTRPGGPDSLIKRDDRLKRLDRFRHSPTRSQPRRATRPNGRYAGPTGERWWPSASPGRQSRRTSRPSTTRSQVLESAGRGRTQGHGREQQAGGARKRSCLPRR